MTIFYSMDIASSSPLNVLRVLRRWRGSVWKSAAAELLIWTACFVVVALIYRHALNPPAQRVFEQISEYCRAGLSDLPLTFMLGFFVTIVVQRWNDTFRNMGYLETQAIHISGLIIGDDERTRLIRRTLARYLCLTQVLVFRDLSVQVQKRFPTYESIVKAGFMLEHEKKRMEEYKLDYDKYWVPINWAFAIVFQARREGKITSDPLGTKITDEIHKFRNSLQMLCTYDWIQVPLAYPQVVFLSVHTYFIIALVGRQFFVFEDDDKSHIDLFIPYMTLLQYLFFVGWMKVAEGLLNPFGEDDDDFECNYLIDKNFQTAMCIVDEGHDDVPSLQKDQFWNATDVDAIYSKETADVPVHPYIGSAARVASSENKQPEAEVEMVVKLKETPTPDQTDQGVQTRPVRRTKTFGAFTSRFKKASDSFKKAFSTRRRGTSNQGTSTDPDHALFRVENGQQTASNSKQTDRYELPMTPVRMDTLETVTEEDTKDQSEESTRKRSYREGGLRRQHEQEEDGANPDKKGAFSTVVSFQ